MDNDIISFIFNVYLNEIIYGIMRMKREPRPRREKKQLKTEWEIVEYTNTYTQLEAGGTDAH